MHNLRNNWKIRQIMDTLTEVPLNGIYTGKTKAISIRVPQLLLDAVKAKGVPVTQFLVDSATRCYLWKYGILPRPEVKRERWAGSIEDMPL